MPRGLKFGLIGCGGLVALSVLLVGCMTILYRTGPSTFISSETDPATFLGKPTTDPEIQEYVIQNECESTGMERRCFRSGVDFSYDTGGKVSGMWYHLQGSNLHQPYKGPVPGDLSASDTKADVDRKLGPPQQTYPGRASYPPQVPGTSSLSIEFAPHGAPLTPGSTIDEIHFSRGDPVTQRAAEALLE